MPTDLERITSSPELEEQYKAWIQGWHASAPHESELVAVKRALEIAQEHYRPMGRFWEGFGSALRLFPETVVDTQQILSASIADSLWRDWHNVGHDFVTVLGRMTETSGEPSDTTVFKSTRRK
jgi:hypothetical protein